MTLKWRGVNNTVLFTDAIAEHSVHTPLYLSHVAAAGGGDVFIKGIFVSCGISKMSSSTFKRCQECKWINIMF